VVVAAAFFRWEPRALLRPWTRAGLTLAGVVCLSSLVQGAGPWRLLYDQEWMGFQPWEPRRSAELGGLEFSLLRYHWLYDNGMPNADAQRVSQFLHGAGTLPAAAKAAMPAVSEQPDIIVLQSESLFDPGRLQGVDSDTLLPHLHQLAAESRSGDLWVPAFGGGTIRTEFEVLTGIALRYVPNIEYPYLQMSEQTRRSLPQVLHSHGYSTVAIHPNEGSFWNRNATFRGMGFERFVDGSGFTSSAHSGFFVSDAALTSRILQELDAGSGPHFVFAVSIENHGPYDDTQPDIDLAELSRIPVPATLDARSALALRVYMHHLRNADAALQTLADALRARPRRSLLMFYGDHLPSLTPVYDQIGFRDGKPAPLQPVPYVLVDSTQNHTKRHDLAANFVPGYLLAHAQIRDEPFFAISELVRRVTRFGPEYVPAFDAEFGEVNRLRMQRGFCRLYASTSPDSGYACPRMQASANVGNQ
jgi:phosphoglycerol transferase MdoB-like AlkP superfamily enzyme